MARLLATLERQGPDAAEAALGSPKIGANKANRTARRSALDASAVTDRSERARSGEGAGRNASADTADSGEAEAPIV